MNNSELVEIFFSHAFEDLWNEKILDDKLFVVPTVRIYDYLLKIISIPYSEFLYYLIDFDLPEISPCDMTQCSSFSACEIEMCENLIAEDNPGFDFVDIGMLYPQYCKTAKEGALRKYGENQIKTSRQLGLTYEYCGLWYLDCIGYAYPKFNQHQRQALLARTLLRDPLYGRIIRDLLIGDTNLAKYLTGLSESTILRRGPGITKILAIAVTEAENNGIRLGRCDFIRPPRISHTRCLSQENLVKLYDKKVDKSFLTRGMTVPKKSVHILETILNCHIEKGESIDVIIEFNHLEYQGRINHVNIATTGTDCYQIFWKSHPSLVGGLQLFYGLDEDYKTLRRIVEVWGDIQSKHLIIKPIAPGPELDFGE